MIFFSVGNPGLATSFSFKYRSMLWMYSHYKYFTHSLQGLTFDIRRL